MTSDPCLLLFMAILLSRSGRRIRNALVKRQTHRTCGHIRASSRFVRSCRWRGWHRGVSSPRELRCSSVSSPSRTSRLQKPHPSPSPNHARRLRSRSSSAQQQPTPETPARLASSNATFHAIRFEGRRCKSGRARSFSPRLLDLLTPVSKPPPRRRSGTERCRACPWPIPVKSLLRRARRFGCARPR